MQAWRRLAVGGVLILAAGPLFSWPSPAQAQATPPAGQTTRSPPPEAPGANTPTSDKDEEKATPGGRVVIAVPTHFESLDPHLTFDTRNSLVQLNFYEALYRWQADPVRVAPWLAQSYTLSEDGRTYRFTLRKDARFHDGSEITARDVVYSVERILALKSGVAHILSGLVNPGSTKAIDAENVEFTLTRPSALFLTLLPSVHIVNATLLKANEVNNDWGRGWLRRNEAGSGPYRLKSFKPGTGFVASRFAPHWNRNWATKAVEEVEVRTVIDSEIALDALTKGEIHVLNGPLLGSQKSRIKGIKDLKLLEDASPRLFLGLIHSGREPLNAKPMRQALAQAFDYDGFIRSTLGTGARRTPLPLPPSFVSRSVLASTALPSYDIEAAGKSLEKVTPPVSGLTIGAILGDVHSERAAVVMAQGLMRLGIAPRIVAEPWPSILARMRDEKQMFDLLFLWRGARYLDPNNWVGEMFDCDLFGTGNSSWYCNKDVDTLIKEARTSADGKARGTALESAASKVAADAGGLFVATSRASAGYVARLKGLRFTPTGQTFEFRYLSLE